MPREHKRQDDEGTISVLLTPPKRTRRSPPAPKRSASDDISSDLSTPSPAKKTRHDSHSKVRATLSSLRTHSAATKCATKASPGSPLSRSRLVPRGERKSARIGQKDVSLLRMRCHDTESGKLKELHFRNMPYSSIDWNDGGHINKINNWRNQIYGRAGLKSKAVTMWLPDEELWFELYFQLSIAESRARGILLPKTGLILDAFNQTFIGHVLQDSHGNNVGPRVERKSNAFTSKFNRMCPHLRTRLQQCVFGKSGDIFVPVITLEMLQAYKEVKNKITDKSIEKESEYAEHLEEGLHLFSHLPSIDDVPVLSVEDNAAAVLISMATQSVNSRQSQHTAGPFQMTPCYTTPQQSKHSEKGSATPELFLTSSASSQQSDGPMTPTRTISLSENDNNNTKVLGSGFIVPRTTTPVHGLDIASLIASPD